MTGTLRLPARIFVLFTLVLGGAIFSSPQPAAAGPPDACAVVSKADAAQILGTPVVKSSQRPAGPALYCMLRTASISKSIAITTYRWSSIPEAQSHFHMIVEQTAALMKPSVPIAGLGDEAQQIGPNIYVRKGDAAYVFNVIDGSVGAAKAAKALSLAKKTMAHN